MVTVSYPGVYVREVPSGVHTITGVATSIAAFFGRTMKGPVNKAVRILSPSDFIRTFGGPHPASDLAKSLQQFFANGGTDCYVVRLAPDADAASATLHYLLEDSSQQPVLTATAKTPGVWGNALRLVVDYNTPSSEETFNLRVIREESGREVASEIYTTLSMDPYSPRYAPDFVSQKSSLIDLSLVDEFDIDGAISSAPKGFSESRLPVGVGELGTIISESISESRSCFEISVNGSQFIHIDLKGIDFEDGDTDSAVLSAMQEHINTQISSVVGELGIVVSLESSPEPGDLQFIRITSNSDPRTSVHVRRSSIDDLAGPLMLGVDQGGIEITSYAVLRPVPNSTFFYRGTDGNSPDEDYYSGDIAEQTGFHALDSVDLFNLMVLPGDREVTEETFMQILGPASIYCEQKRAFLLIDALESWTSSSHRPVATRSEADALRRLTVSEYSAVFYPRIEYSDAGIKKTIGPSGLVAGLMARIDSRRGVWKAPAGIEADLRGILGLEVNLTDAENGVLNQLGVNCLRQFPSGFVNWGARTLAGSDDIGSEWKYIPVRRLALFLEESLYRGLRWAVFEPNDEPLWAQIRLNVNVFMMSLFRRGAFQGSTPDQAFFVKCDDETTTQDDRNKGIVNVEVGFAPLKPAEFVVITIQQMAGQLG